MRNLTTTTKSSENRSVVARCGGVGGLREMGEGGQTVKSK